MKIPRFDERNTIFSRLRLTPGTDRYDEYYSRYPDLKNIDDALRELAIIHNEKKCWNSAGDRPGSMEYVIKTAMDNAERLHKQAKETEVSEKQMVMAPIELSRLIKDAAKGYGADLVGIAALEECHHYSYSAGKRTSSKKYGEKIERHHAFAIVVACSLDRDLVDAAPLKDAEAASIMGYALSSSIAAQLVICSKSLGYDAQTDTVIDYRSPLTPLAIEAGLGQYGRCNMLVSPTHGNRLKLAAVLTDMPLLADGPIDFGLTDICRQCNICASKCPAKAISFDDPEIIDGMPVWPFSDTRCMDMWIRCGTDCGICMSVCPFSRSSIGDNTLNTSDTATEK